MTPAAAIPTLEVFGSGFSPESRDVAWARAAHWYATTPLFHMLGREVDGVTVLRYDETKALMADSRLDQASGFLMAGNFVLAGPLAAWWQMLMLNRNGAVHDRLRRLTSAAITPEAVDALRPAMRAAARALADRVLASERCDFVSAFAHPYPLEVWSVWLGVPVERRAAFADVILGLAQIFSPDFKRVHKAVEASLRAGYALADELIAARRNRPGDDLVSALLAVDVGGERLTQDELRATIVGLPFADSSRYQLGLGLAAFVNHPAQWQALREQPGLAPNAVAQIARCYPAIPALLRLAVTDVEYRDLRAGFGTLFVLLVAAANTDPRAFGTGGFDIAARPGAETLSFGFGPHACLGFRFASIEMAEALPVLAERFATLAPAGTPTWLPGVTVAGPVTLPITFEVAR